MKNTGNILWGIVFIALGIIWGVNALGIADINIFFSGWWTLFLIVPSAIGLFKNGNKIANAIVLFVGVVLLLSAQGVIEFAVVRKMILPLILVMIGLGIIFGNLLNEKFNKKIKELNKDGLPNYTATFSGRKDVFQNEVFEGASVDAIFGGVELDLRNAQIQQDRVINASAVFGGIEIFLPSGVNVKVKSTPIFGGVDNKINYTKGENIPTIYVNAFSLFGGVEIR